LPKLANKVFSSAVFYPTHWWNILMSKVLNQRNWWDDVDDALILGARPNSTDAEKLVEIGVTGVVNTCDEYSGPIHVYEKHGIEQLHIPTVDFTHPFIQDVESAVDFISRHADDGGCVYVHCKAGRARSATVAVCWLMEYRKMSGDAAQQLLLENRHQVNKRLLSRPVVIEFQQRRQCGEK